MGRTIIQPIGPLYGEAVNGTVFGQPNGSKYVPKSNTLSISGETEYVADFMINYVRHVRWCNSSKVVKFVNAIAESQDPASNIRFVLASDSDLTTVIGYRDETAGLFNITTSDIITGTAITGGTTYYVAVQLVNNGNVLDSEVYEVTGVS